MGKRTNYYACIVYYESMKAEWERILEDTHIPAFISPLHDKDLDSEGNLKKPHYHILLLFESLKSQTQAEDIFALINGVGCERVLSVRGYSRYLIHLDSPDKAQYNAEDIIELSGANYQSMIRLPQDRYSVIKEIIEYCCQNDIDHFAEVLEYAKDNRQDWFTVLIDGCSVVLINYLKSRSWSKHRDR